MHSFGEKNTFEGVVTRLNLVKVSQWQSKKERFLPQKVMYHIHPGTVNSPDCNVHLVELSKNLSQFAPQSSHNNRCPQSKKM